MPSSPVPHLGLSLQWPDLQNGAMGCGSRSPRLLWVDICLGWMELALLKWSYMKHHVGDLSV
jgi:hypothetical protein